MLDEKTIGAMRAYYLDNHGLRETAKKFRLAVTTVRPFLDDIIRPQGAVLNQHRGGRTRKPKRKAAAAAYRASKHETHERSLDELGKTERALSNAIDARSKASRVNVLAAQEQTARALEGVEAPYMLIVGDKQLFCASLDEAIAKIGELNAPGARLWKQLRVELTVNIVE